jgi:O-antigen/teichoic acid export membrane protein
MINHKFGIAATGLYTVATKLAKPLSFVVSIVQQSWVPFKFHIHKTDSNPAHTFRQLTSLYWVGIIMLWGVLSLLTPLLYHWLVDPKYWAGIPYVPFIMAISVAQAIYFTVTTGFELSSRQVIAPRASFIGMITLVGLSLILVDFYAPYSFILAQALAFLIMGSILFPESQRMLKISYPFLPIVLFGGATISLVVFLFDCQKRISILLGLFGVVIIGLTTIRVLFPYFLAKRLFPIIFRKSA